MPGRAEPPRNQASTHFTFEDIALATGCDLDELEMRIQRLAMSQDLPFRGDWVDNAQFVLATRIQVEDSQWCRRLDPAVVVRCVGDGTDEYLYAFDRRRVETPDVPVCHPPLREAKLRLCLYDIVKALSQGRAVVVHCNKSFHRGPLGLMAILKVLLDIHPHKTKAMILDVRDIWEGYVDGVSAREWKQLVQGYHWAKGLAVWEPPAKRQAAGKWASSQVVDPMTARLAAEEGKYLYRAMTKGLKEFDARPAWKYVNAQGRDLALLVLDCVSNGSKWESPFLHFSRSYLEARKWHCMGENFRDETGTIMCRVRIEALSQAVPDLYRPVQPLEYVDLSSQRISQPLITPHHLAEKFGGPIQQLLPALSHAHTVKEVLVAWRGSLPMSMFEVIHGSTGEFIRMLDESVPLSASSHWRQTSVEAINLSVDNSFCCHCICCCAIFQFTAKVFFIIL